MYEQDQSKDQQQQQQQSRTGFAMSTDDLQSFLGSLASNPAGEGMMSNATFMDMQQGASAQGSVGQNTMFASPSGPFAGSATHMNSGMSHPFGQQAHQIPMQHPHEPPDYRRQSSEFNAQIA
ncbi:hypothetical protein A4X13_0g7610, partial [Tilletia indica]